MTSLLGQFWKSGWCNAVLYLLGSVVFVVALVIVWARANGFSWTTIALSLLVLVIAVVIVGFLVVAFNRDYQAPPTANSDLRNTTYFLSGLAAFGFVVVVIWGATRSHPFAVIAQGLLLLGGAGLVGGVLGLLFGIPKSKSDPAATRPPATNSSEAAADNRYAANTNLEQISDWLTKIIVGVSLTQVPTIRTEFVSAAEYFGKGLVASSATDVTAAAVAAAILIYGLSAGFLAGYLLTRIFLPGAFSRADQQLIEAKEQLVEERRATARFGQIMTEVSKDLYRYDEKGFGSAITKLEGILVSDIARSNPALWAYLAAAHGQAYKWENANRPATDVGKAAVLKKHRDTAFEAVKKAIELSEDWKPILQTMWDKNQKGKEEDDLEVFYDDLDFKKIMGA